MPMTTGKSSKTMGRFPINHFNIVAKINKNQAGANDGRKELVFM
jgi:hypothetical protein